MVKLISPWRKLINNIYAYNQMESRRLLTLTGFLLSTLMYIPQLKLTLYYVFFFHLLFVSYYVRLLSLYLLLSKYANQASRQISISQSGSIYIYLVHCLLTLTILLLYMMMNVDYKLYYEFR